MQYPWVNNNVQSWNFNSRTCSALKYNLLFISNLELMCFAESVPVLRLFTPGMKFWNIQRGALILPAIKLLDHNILLIMMFKILLFFFLFFFPSFLLSFLPSFLFSWISLCLYCTIPSTPSTLTGRSISKPYTRNICSYKLFAYMAPWSYWQSPLRDPNAVQIQLFL